MISPDLFRDKFKRTRKMSDLKTLNLYPKSSNSTNKFTIKFDKQKNQVQFQTTNEDLNPYEEDTSQIKCDICLETTKSEFD